MKWTILMTAFRFIRMIKRRMTEYVYYHLYTKKNNKKVCFSNFNKVIFVAHPDDEVIFFGNQLLSEPGWLVVCVTNGGNKARLKEFTAAMKYIKADYILWNFRDGVNITWKRKRLNSMISEVLRQKAEWARVLTHDIEGEYGHYQHKQLHQSVSDVYSVDNLYFTVNRSRLMESLNRLPVEKQGKKKDIFRTYYNSQILAMDRIPEYFEYEGQEKR